MNQDDPVARAARIQKKLLDQIKLQRQELAAIADRLTRLEEAQASQSDLLGKIFKRVLHIAPGLGAVLRALKLAPDRLDYPHRLTAQRYRLHSQNEEDGMILALFDQIGATTRRFVEIGSGLSGGNSACLARELGWTGVMLDGDEAHVTQVGRRFPGVTAVAAWITRENVNQLVLDAGFGGEVDFLSIDLDGNDYWVWEALTACSPRLVVVEYNSAFGADRAVTIPYDSKFDRHDYRFVYYGASLVALARLADAKGYRLIATEPTGVNAFFLRNDVAPSIPGCSPQRAYHLLKRYDVWMQVKREDIYSYVARAKLPLVDVGDPADTASRR